MNLFKLFIVEDDKMFQKMLTYLLKADKECELHVFSNAKDCLDHLYLEPDIISLDYTLPDMNGESLLHTIKEKCPNTEVLILSGQSDLSTVASVLELGAYDYITKDITTKYRFKNTIHRLKELIRLRRMIRMSSVSI